MPNFSRGPEIEITTMQDVEMMKAMLAQLKIHIPTKTLERAIVMPRDLDNYHPAYPKISEMLPINPYRKKAETKKKKGKKDEDAGARNIAVEGRKLEKDEKLYPPQKNRE